MLFYLLDSLLGDLPFASWASRSKGNRHGGAFFYVPIIYRFQALIILLLSGRYCRARILRSARGGEPAQMVRSAPRTEPRPPHRRPARTALAPPPAPPARGGEAAAGIRGGGGRRPPPAPPPPPRPAHMVRPCRWASCRRRAASPGLRQQPPAAPTA